MHCPNCNTIFKIAFRQGVEIDYCPQCRGIWLDKGELDKLMERAVEERQGKFRENHFDDTNDREVIDNHQPMKRKRGKPAPEKRQEYRDYDDERRNDKRRKKRDFGDFIEDIFDIFD